MYALQVATTLLHGLDEEPIDAGSAHGVDEPVDVELTRVEHAVAAGRRQDADAAGVQTLASLGEPGVRIVAQHVDGEGCRHDCGSAGCLARAVPFGGTDCSDGGNSLFPSRERPSALHGTGVGMALCESFRTRIILGNVINGVLISRGCGHVAATGRLTVADDSGGREVFGFIGHNEIGINKKVPVPVPLSNTNQRMLWAH